MRNELGNGVEWVVRADGWAIMGLIWAIMGVCLGCGRGWRMDVPKVAKRLKYGGFCGGFGAEGIRADGMACRALADALGLVEGWMVLGVYEGWLNGG